jgi:hypothetical protein
VSAWVSWLRSLSLAQSEEDRKSATNHYSTLIAIEQQRRQARNVKRATHKLKSFGTSRIIAPDSSGEWVEHTLKEAIEAGCQWENSRPFSQTADTPFMQSPLLEDFGYLAQDPATRQVLNGSYSRATEGIFQTDG